ncbi:UNVERIFIED_CONTAM: hypothetical protein GTU68_038293 [Idotea baltica]|nr:hypothetical protein [Idotea baltica]
MTMTELRCQHNLMILGLIGLAVLYMLRVNLSVAIVAMVSHAEKVEYEGAFKESCPITESSNLIFNSISKNQKSIPKEGINWNEKAQGRVLGSFFYGYFLTNFAGGRLADKFGGKRVFGAGVLLTSVLAFFLPAAAQYSEKAFAFIRVLQGMTEGVTFPSMNTLMSNWVQPSRRALFMSRVTGGTIIGTVVTLSGGGWLAQTSFGWPCIFYLSGAIGLIYSLIWFHMVSDNPRTHSNVTEEERNLILQDLGHDKLFNDVEKSSQHTPWKKVFTSKPFIAVMVVHFGSSFGFYFLLTELPTYLSTVHHFDIKSNGLISSLPYMLMWILSVLYANQVHRLTSNKVLSIRMARKISTSLGQFGPMVLLLCISLAGCNSLAAVTIICLAVGMSGFVQCGFFCGFQDLAPNYAGTITGISNTIASIAGVIAPRITGFFKSRNSRPLVNGT